MKRSVSLSTMSLALLLLSIEASVLAAGNAENALDLTIRSLRSDLRRGDEIQIVFKITNKGQTVHKYEDRSYDRSGRLHEYSLVAHRQEGTQVPDPRWGHEQGIMGGLSGGMKPIAPGESFERTVALNLWALVNQPGRYTVVGTYRYSLPNNDARQKNPSDIRRMRSVTLKSQPIEITIAPRTDQEMADYIDALTEELKSIEGQNSREDRRRPNIVAKLAYTCDPRIVPTLVELLYATGPRNTGFWAQQGLRFYVPKTGEVRDSLVKVAQASGLKGPMLGILELYRCRQSQLESIIAKSMSSTDPDVLHSAVAGAHKYPNDAYTEKLIELALDVNSPARDAAITAIAYNRTDEGVAALKSIMKEGSEGFRRRLGYTIEHAYRRHPVRPERTDELYTAALMPIAMDMNDLLWAIAINQIVRTRTQEGIAALRAYLDDPAEGNALIENDQALKAIRHWLTHSDPAIRSYVEEYVRRLCKPPLGRPLRTDDFPPHFQDFDARQKKRILANLNQRQAPPSTSNQAGQTKVNDRPKIWAKKLTLAGVENFHKVSSVLYRGQQPTAKGMKNIEKMGIKTIVNLRSFNSDRREMQGTKMIYNHITMKAWHAEDKELVQFLKIVTSTGNQPVFVHCKYGADRTGTMCAVYRIAVQGWTRDRAIEEMTNGGFGYHSIWQNLIDYIKKLDINKIKQKAGIKD